MRSTPSKTNITTYCVLIALGVFCCAPEARAAGNTVSIASDTAVLLSGSGITLVLAGGSSLVSYSADATTLTLSLTAGSNVTVKSTNLYTLTNSLSSATQCSGLSYSFVTFTSNIAATVTVTPSAAITCPAASSGGGGAGGSVIIPPTISSFLASPASIVAGQSSTLSWSLTGASSINITPNVSTSSLNSVTGTATVTPSTTTAYTLVAANAFGQSVTTTTIVTVMTSSAGTQPPPVSGPANPLPPLSPPSPSTGPAYCLVNRASTFSLILNGIRHGIANPGLLFSWGYNFNDAVLDTAAYQGLPNGDLLGPNDGALVKAPGSPTVYLISGQAKHGFTSASVFRGLGYKFSSVLTIPMSQLNGLPESSLVANPSTRHLPGANVSSRGTIFFLGETARFPYTSLAVFNTWNLHNDFSRVVPANAADLKLPLGPAVTPRSSCANQ